MRLFTGEINLIEPAVHQTLDGAPFQAVRIPWLSVRHDARALLEGRFEPSEVVVAHPTLRLRRRKDGTWNLQGLLASPWPGPAMKTPPILIQNGTVELSDGDPDAPGRGDPPRRGRARSSRPARGGSRSRGRPRATRSTASASRGRSTSPPAASSWRATWPGWRSPSRSASRLPAELQAGRRAARADRRRGRPAGRPGRASTRRPRPGSATTSPAASARGSGTAPSCRSRSTTCRRGSRSATACSRSTGPRATTARPPSGSTAARSRSATPSARRSTWRSTSST